MKIRLRYLKAFVSDGKAYYYVRRKGRPIIRISGHPGSPEFMAAYQAALDSEPAKTSRHAAGTFGKLVTNFYGSAEFANLKPSSQSIYRRVLEEVAATHGHRPAATLPTEKAVKIVEDIGRDRPALANLTKSVLRRLMKYGKIKPNPFDDITPYKGGAHHTWTEAELAAFEAKWPLGTRQRLAYALLLYTGQRGGDVCKMRRQDIHEGSINVVQQKTGAALSVPIHPNLAEALKVGPVNLHYLLADSKGCQMARKALTDMMKRAAKLAELGPECVPHGLRKALMRRLAEHDASVKQIAAVSGHKSLKEVERYTEAADQRRLSKAAMRKLSDE